MLTIEFKVSFVYVNTRDSYHLSQNSTFHSLRAWPSRHIQYSMWVHLVNYKYTGCPRRNVPDFGRVFLMLKYTDITQNTYIQS